MDEAAADHDSRALNFPERSNLETTKGNKTRSLMSIHIAITRRVRPGREAEFQVALREFFQTRSRTAAC